MKIGGKALVTRNSTKITIVRDNGNEAERQVVELTVSPLPLSFFQIQTNRGIYETFDAPEVPVKMENGVLLRDPLNPSRFAMKPNENDPEYRRKLYATNRRMNAVKFREALKHDPSVEFETQEPAETASPEEWRKYADTLADEIESAGFTATEVEYIITTADSQSLNIDTAGAVDLFLQGTKGRDRPEADRSEQSSPTNSESESSPPTTSSPGV